MIIGNIAESLWKFLFMQCGRYASASLGNFLFMQGMHDRCMVTAWSLMDEGITGQYWGNSGPGMSAGRWYKDDASPVLGFSLVQSERASAGSGVTLWTRFRVSTLGIGT